MRLHERDGEGIRNVKLEQMSKTFGTILKLGGFLKEEDHFIFNQ